ncbi:copper-binding protein [Conexibacter arvalis]|uniref:Plastocyanin n=1 Tax=Conexibacter arvalis TaxID=912552 RepID=A0A840I8P8_9ACTN|nr:copper-binding protein [Conexibacter arvalis]MBB4660902.1 plastocyanin [Conexibacter arvalis]
MSARRRNRPLLALALVAAAGGAATLPGGVAQAATRTVTLRDIAFHPARVTIARGDRVVWRWRDGGIRHNVVSRSFRGTGARSSGSYGVTFRRAGTFRYRCTLHPGMDGTVVVRR